MAEYIILVDQNDKPLGKIEKLEAHKQGLLHRAFSIFVFSPDYKRLLIQKRNKNKYHSGGLWANTTCSHPRFGESLAEAVHRRLMEEMGFDTDLQEIGSFIYKVKLDNELFEHEYDHIFIGTYEGQVRPNPLEVCDYSWADLYLLEQDVNKNSFKYAYWFKRALPIVIQWLDKQNL